MTDLLLAIQLLSWALYMTFWKGDCSEGIHCKGSVINIKSVLYINFSTCINYCEWLLWYDKEIEIQGQIWVAKRRDEKWDRKALFCILDHILIICLTVGKYPTTILVIQHVK